MRLSNNQILEIEELRTKGVKVREIAIRFNINPSTVTYHLNKEKELKRKREWWNKKSKEEKQQIYKKNLPYLRNYQKRRYNSDEKFKEKNKQRSRDYYKRKKKVKNESNIN